MENVDIPSNYPLVSAYAKKMLQPAPAAAPAEAQVQARARPADSGWPIKLQTLPWTGFCRGVTSEQMRAWAASNEGTLYASHIDVQRLCDQGTHRNNLSPALTEQEILDL